MSGGNQSRKSRSYYRAVSAARMIAEPDMVEFTDEVDDQRAVQPRLEKDTSADVGESPTIILTPDQIALLASETPPPISFPGAAESGYIYVPEPEPPTIVLDVHALLSAPPPPPEEPPFIAALPDKTQVQARPDKTQVQSRSDKTQVRSHPDASWPIPTPSIEEPVVPRPRRRRRGGDQDREEELMRLRRQRMDREAGELDRMPEEPYISDKLRQWWDEIQPGIDRVLGRAHRAGVSGARATSYQTSSQLPAIKLSTEEQAVPAIKRLSNAARHIGARAQTAATPALTKLHSRAEQVAQKIVDQIDEKLGGRPPMQHVLLGPGRMIVSFAHHVTIREAQILIAGVQARSLRRLVGYNAYLVLVPPGRESRYAERLRGYREVTGVHFGPQRAAASSVPAAPQRGA